MTSEPLLVVDDLQVAYGTARAVFGLSFEIGSGRALALLGPNGAGKSSVAAALAGVVRPSGGRVHFDGQDVTRLPSHRRARLGVAYVPEGRGIFPQLTVLENLRVLLRGAVPASERAAALDRAVERFPILGERRHQSAGTLSGGQQQMLALARVLAAPPRLLIADELSLGLAPLLVDMVFGALQEARQAGVAVLLIEQFVDRALGIADDVLLLGHGRAVWTGPASAAGPEVLRGYLGPEVQAVGDRPRP